MPSGHTTLHICAPTAQIVLTPHPNSILAVNPESQRRLDYQQHLGNCSLTLFDRG